MQVSENDFLGQSQPFLIGLYIERLHQNKNGFLLMIFTGELKVHFNTRIIAHFRSIKLQNLLLNPFKEIREFSMVLVSNCP